MHDDRQAPDLEAQSALKIAPGPHPARLRGSAPLRAQARVPQQAGAQQPGPSAAPPQPLALPGISAPDVAFEFKPCLGAGQDGAIKDAVLQSVAGAVDVRLACVGNSSRLGIWMRPTAGADDDPARQMALASLDLLRQGENYSAFINASLIRSQANDAFSNQPKRLNGDAQPDHHGPVHLTGMHVDFKAPNRIITTVDGFDERPWPDVDFHLITTDTLSASAGEAQCHSDHSLDTDTGWLQILTAAMGALTVLVSGWFALPALIFFAQGVVVAGQGAPDIGEGAGSAVHALPTEIMIPAKLKLVMNYERVEVNAGGIFAGGFMALAVRTPSLRINGGGMLAVTQGTPTVNRTFSVTTEDLRKPLSFAWTADGTVANPGAQSTGVTFHLPNTTAGHTLPKRVQVQVTDADGLSAQAVITVQVHIVKSDPEDNLPPICRIKPWLPQCQ